MLKCWKMIAYHKKNMFLSWYTTFKTLTCTNMPQYVMKDDCLIKHLNNLLIMCFYSHYLFEECLRIHCLHHNSKLTLSGSLSFMESFINSCFINNENLQNIDIEWFHTWFNNPFNIRKKSLSLFSHFFRSVCKAVLPRLNCICGSKLSAVAKVKWRLNSGDSVRCTLNW